MEKNVTGKNPYLVSLLNEIKGVANSLQYRRQRTTSRKHRYS